MIKIKIRDEELIIDFEHQNNTNTYYLKKPFGKSFKSLETSFTICSIISENKNYKGKAVCKEGNYSKSEGRKRSLKNCFKNSNFTKEERRSIWKAYFEKCKI